MERTDGETIFYPFAGPDFMTVNRFYPNASRYVRIPRGVGEDLRKSEKRLCRVEAAFAGHRPARIHHGGHHTAHSARRAPVRADLPHDLGGLLRLLASR